MEYTQIATGTAYDGEPREGTARIIRGIKDVVTLMKDPALSEAVVFMEVPGTTTVGPVLRRVLGVVCTEGGTGSHIAIVSREFELPCVMGAKGVVLDDVDRRQVRIDPSGAVSVAFEGGAE
jgi:signal transduction protein with GAF and PtsI domain